MFMHICVHRCDVTTAMYINPCPFHLPAVGSDIVQEDIVIVRGWIHTLSGCMRQNVLHIHIHVVLYIYCMNNIMYIVISDSITIVSFLCM